MIEESLFSTLRSKSLICSLVGNAMLYERIFRIPQRDWACSSHKLVVGGGGVAEKWHFSNFHSAKCIVLSSTKEAVN